MSTYQKIIILGHLGDVPQTKNFETGKIVTNISVATTETWNDKQTGEKVSNTEWHRCFAFGKVAELIDKYCSKGDKVLVEGKNRTRKYTDTNNVERWITEVQIDNITFVSKSQSQNQGSAVEQYQQKNNQQSSTFTPKEEEHDDLPF